MKIQLSAMLVLLSLAINSEAQLGRQGGRAGGPGGGMGGPLQPHFGEAMAKLFGEHSAFSANMLMETKSESGIMSMPGKLAYLQGRTRFEMDMSKIKGGAMPPEAAQQMKEMGMGEMISINRPDKNETYLVYPGLKAYAVSPSTDGKAGAEPVDKLDLKRTELGKETIDGHPCTKFKVVIKNPEGKEQETTVWAATDLKDFPIRMETLNEGIPTTMTYRDVKFEKPEKSQFNPPEGFQRYNDVGTMMREAMLKRFAPGAGFPPPN